MTAWTQPLRIQSMGTMLAGRDLLDLYTESSASQCLPSKHSGSDPEAF